MELFSQIPKVQYNQFKLQNLLNNVTVIGKHLEKYSVFYPHTIKDGQRADTIAHDYYGSSEYAWLVYLANYIYDPYSQWPLTDRELADMVKQKYGTLYPLMQQVHHYFYVGITTDTPEEVARRNWRITPVTYSRMSAEDQSGWAPKTVWDYEVDLNDEKRTIRLLSSDYLKQVQQEIGELLP